MNNPQLRQARFSDDYKYIIDSRGEKLEYDDPRVVHVWAYDEVSYANDMVKNVFDKLELKYRFAGRINQKLLQDARKVCSGRECMSFTSFAGTVYNDMVENRGAGEVTLYYYLNQQGPCQIGAWPDMWNVFATRFGIQDAIFNVFPGVTNNWLGQGYRIGLEFITGLVLSDIFHEAENVIKCLAVDKEEALMRFTLETEKVADSFKLNLRAVDAALKQWVKQVSQIPLRSAVTDVPKIIIFGSGEVELLHYPVTDYFIRQEILPKTLDLTGFFYCINAEIYIREAFRRGKILIKDQIRMLPFMLSMYDPGTNIKDRFLTFISALTTLKTDALRKKYHDIAKKSGLLLSDKYISLQSISLNGNTLTTANSITETIQNVGAYVSYSNSGVYDGMMHLGSFNCQPAVNAQAIVRPLAAKQDIPYAAIDMEGPWLSTSQSKVLEALSVQARRYHAQR